MVHIIDLHFQGRPGTIAAFLVETSEGPVLVESGPASTLPALEIGVREAGHELCDIKHVFLTHIHFDHAGAAWKLAELGALIHLHPFGVDHLADPEVLWKSAKRIFQDDMGRLWGEMRPIPPSKLHACNDEESVRVGDLTFKALHTPGHAKHHIAWQLGDGVFAGDIAGVALERGPVQPPCPPPDIHLGHWKESIGKLRDCAPESLYLTHYGTVNGADLEKHLVALECRLADWAQWMDRHVATVESASELVPAFTAYVTDELRGAGLDEEAVADYEIANPAFMSVAGLARFLKKHGHS